MRHDYGEPSPLHKGDRVALTHPAYEGAGGTFLSWTHWEGKVRGQRRYTFGRVRRDRDGKILVVGIHHMEREPPCKN